MLFALLAATGLRIGEALASDRDTSDLEAGVLLISHGKGLDPRLFPPHPTTTAGRTRYATWRDKQHEEHEQHGRGAALVIGAFRDPPGALSGLGNC